MSYNKASIKLLCIEKEKKNDRQKSLYFDC